MQSDTRVEVSEVSRVSPGATLIGRSVPTQWSHQGYGVHVCPGDGDALSHDWVSDTHRPGASVHLLWRRKSTTASCLRLGKQEVILEGATGNF